jgi:hypothetical protein
VENFHNLRFSQIPKLGKKATIGKVSPISQIGAKEVNCVGKPPKTTAPFSGSPHNTQRKFKEARTVFFTVCGHTKITQIGLRDCYTGVVWTP